MSKVAEHNVQKDSIAKPDQEELLLTKLVLGYDNDADYLLDNENDANGLKNAMKMFDELIDNEDFFNTNENNAFLAENDEEESNLDFEIEDSDDEAVQDAELFDIENSDEEMEQAFDEEVSSSSESEEDAWNDSDDENIKINIYQNKRLRKLKRSYEETDMIGTEYCKRLRTQFEKIYPRPEWIDVPASEQESDDSEVDNDEENDESQVNDYNALLRLLKESNKYMANVDKSSKIMPTDKLTVQRLKDANFKQLSKSGIQSISYHPRNHNLIMTAGYDKSIRMYHLDNNENNIIQSVFLKGTPIQSCQFYSEVSKDVIKNCKFKQSQNNNIVFASGRRRYMHKWDLNEINNSNNIGISKISRLQGQEFSQKSYEKFKLGHIFEKEGTDGLKSHGIVALVGSNGYVNIVNATTGQLYTFLKISGHLIDIAIDYKPSTSNGIDTIIIAINKQGEVYEFNVSKNCNNKVERYWKDPSVFNVTTIAIGGGYMSDSYLHPVKDIVFNIQER
ncbi:unnamed protein product [Hanseniaspora opuntiae]